MTSTDYSVLKSVWLFVNVGWLVVLGLAAF